ncbi:MAG: hypothetical protein FWF75_09665 [Propionibacteriaceae bacterium]|nr:hypothetical protein [Propionibacteriaceae bacterium]
MKKAWLGSLCGAVVLALAAGCTSGAQAPAGGSGSAATGLAALIAQAQEMTNEQLFAKAIAESNGKTMYGIGNTSRGATAATSFIAELTKIDPSYTGKIDWSQPKNNSIFTTLNADITSSQHTYSMTLIQDGNQIQSKEINTGNLLNFIPKEWADAKGVDVAADGDPLALETVTKIFMYNNIGDTGTQYDNMWDFVAPGQSPMFMGVNSEPVGKNFLYMLTQDKYAKVVKAAFDALPADQQATFQKTVDAVTPDVATLGLSGDDAKYALAWVKLWVAQYNVQTDDGPICNQLVSSSAKGESALLVYSKLRAIEESSTSSVKNVTVAAYQDGYQGAGGFGYKIYEMLPKTSPLPWTAMAFISYMATTTDGFSAWSKDVGSYSANPTINKDHSKDGFVDGTDEFPAKDDKGIAWWTSDEGGRMVIEDPAYVSKTAVTMSDWVDMINNGK